MPVAHFGMKEQPFANGGQTSATPCGWGLRCCHSKRRGLEMVQIIHLAKERKVRQKADTTRSPAHYADALSFMRKRRPRGGGIDHWLITPSGDYSLDCETGRKLADEYLAYIGLHHTIGDATLLTCIVREMVDRAKNGEGWTGVHVGFLQRVNEAAMVAAYCQYGNLSTKGPSS